MKTKYLSTVAKNSVLAGVLAVALAGGGRASAVPMPGMLVAGGPVAGGNGFQRVGFEESKEALKLRQAYKILATGDHDYAGHRMLAMHEVEAAAKVLGFDLWGDDRHREPQLLSNDRLRESRRLLKEVQLAAAVKDQMRVMKHLDAAIGEIDVALAIR